MSNHTPSKETLNGHAYSMGEFSDLYVFPGLAYKKKYLGTDQPYLFSVSAVDVSEYTEDKEGEPVTQTVYQTSSQTYVPLKCAASYSAVDFLIEGTVYQYTESFTVQDGTEYVRVSSDWTSIADKNIPATEFKQKIKNKEIRQLWPVWTVANY